VREGQPHNQSVRNRAGGYGRDARGDALGNGKIGVVSDGKRNRTGSGAVVVVAQAERISSRGFSCRVRTTVSSMGTQKRSGEEERDQMREETARGDEAQEDWYISSRSNVQRAHPFLPKSALWARRESRSGSVRINDANQVRSGSDLDIVEVETTARHAGKPSSGTRKVQVRVRRSRPGKSRPQEQTQTVVKEIKLRNEESDPHDYGTKKGHVEAVTSRAGDKQVPRVTIMFREGGT